MCPVGFEINPTKPNQVYSPLCEISESDTWIIIGDISKCYPCFHIKQWKDINTDIDCQFPEFYNIRKPELGIQKKISAAFTTGTKAGGNLHCLIEFEKKLEP